MDKWIHYHKKAIKRTGCIVVIILLVFYAALVWEVNYFFKRDNFDEGFRDVALNETFEYRGMELMIKGIEILTPQQVIKRYGDPQTDIYDDEGNVIYSEAAVDPDLIYVLVNFDIKKLVEDASLNLIDLQIYDKVTAGCLEKNVHGMVVESKGPNKKLEVGDELKDEVAVYCLTSKVMEEKYAKDPAKDKIFMAFPAYEPDMQPIRIALN